MPYSGLGGQLVIRWLADFAHWLAFKLWLGPSHWYDWLLVKVMDVANLFRP